MVLGLGGGLGEALDGVVQPSNCCCGWPHVVLVLFLVIHILTIWWWGLGLVVVMVAVLSEVGEGEVMLLIGLILDTVVVIIIVIIIILLLLLLFSVVTWFLVHCRCQKAEWITLHVVCEGWWVELHRTITFETVFHTGSCSGCMLLFAVGGVGSTQAKEVGE